MPDTSTTLRLEATLDHLGLCSPEPQRLAAFYERVMGYRLTADEQGWWAQGPHRRLRFLAGAPKSLAFAAYRVSSPEQLDALKARLKVEAWDFEVHRTPVFDEAISLLDTDGNRLVFGYRAEDSPQPEQPTGAGLSQALKARLQHLVMASRNAERLMQFFQNVLGFVLSDVVLDDEGALRTSFLRCGAEHHSFAVFQADENRLDHHCYEADDWGLIRDWGDRLADQDVPVKWGPGRHGPGNNLFLFFHDLDGNWVEVSAELEVVEPDRPVGVWPHEEKTLNRWGSAPLRS